MVREVIVHYQLGRDHFGDESTWFKREQRLHCCRASGPQRCGGDSSKGDDGVMHQLIRVHLYNSRRYCEIVAAGKA